MERKQILELALQALQQQKAGIEVEIETLRAELAETGTAGRQKNPLPSAVMPKRRLRTPAERKAQAQKMREYWAAKRAKAAKPVLQPKTAPTAAAAKMRGKTDAQKKALVLKMKEARKKRKASANAKAK